MPKRAFSFSICKWKLCFVHVHGGEYDSIFNSEQSKRMLLFVIYRETCIINVRQRSLVRTPYISVLNMFFILLFNKILIFFDIDMQMCWCATQTQIHGNLVYEQNSFAFILHFWNLSFNLCHIFFHVSFGRWKKIFFIGIFSFPLLLCLSHIKPYAICFYCQCKIEQICKLIFSFLSFCMTLFFMSINWRLVLA